MLDFQKTGMAYLERNLSNCIDFCVLTGLKLYFWPYFLIGNADHIKDIVGITLNGIKPIDKS
jgi:hypothetical protein